MLYSTKIVTVKKKMQLTQLICFSSWTLYSELLHIGGQRCYGKWKEVDPIIRNLEYRLGPILTVVPRSARGQGRIPAEKIDTFAGLARNSMAYCSYIAVSATETGQPGAAWSGLPGIHFLVARHTLYSSD